MNTTATRTNSLLAALPTLFDAATARRIEQARKSILDDCTTAQWGRMTPAQKIEADLISFLTTPTGQIVGVCPSDTLHLIDHEGNCICRRQVNSHGESFVSSSPCYVMRAWAQTNREAVMRQINPVTSATATTPNVFSTSFGDDDFDRWPTATEIGDRHTITVGGVQRCAGLCGCVRDGWFHRDCAACQRAWAEAKGEVTL